jgi:hypothetical protein
VCAIICDYVCAKLATWVKSGQKVGKESTKPLGFMIPYYFYIYYISSHDFSAIRLLELTSIYLLQKRHTKLVAERSYHLRCGQGNLL